ncbi:MAG: 50S ribosomal protein L18Ae [bacterium]
MTKPYQIEGDFQMGRIRQHFVLQVVAKDEQAAKDRVYATLGSRHGVNRREINVLSAKLLKPDDVTDATARHNMKAK